MNYLWQGRKDSNSQQTVLETATLPIELHPYMAEETGFEPAEGCPSPDFESGALSQALPLLYIMFHFFW